MLTGQDPDRVTHPNAERILRLPPDRTRAYDRLVFLDIYLNRGEVIPRTDVEFAIEESLADVCAVAGGGSGVMGSNIDLELLHPDAVARVVGLLRALGVRGDTMLAFDGREMRLDEYVVRDRSESG